MESGKIDLRVQKTLEAIDHTFCRLLMERDYGQITVTMLCQEAKIGKKTFYTYYTSLDNLLLEKVSHLSDGFMKRIARYRVPDDIETINREFYLYGEEQGPVYERIICSASLYTVGSGLMTDLVHKTWRNSAMLRGLDEGKSDLLLTFIYETGSSLYRQWVADGKVVPLEQVIRLSGAILKGGIAQFQKEVQSLS